MGQGSLPGECYFRAVAFNATFAFLRQNLPAHCWAAELTAVFSFVYLPS
jgi:hypothetical protein